MQATSTPASVAAAVQRLALEPHPEGGYFRRIYTSPAQQQAPGAAPRPCASAILFLLPRGCTSSLHSLGSDEVWLHQGGVPLTVVQVGAGGAVVETRVLPGAPHTVPARELFGAYVPEAGEGEGGECYALVCCVVVPGFVWEEFVMPRKEDLLARFAGQPEALQAVQRLCSPRA
jgi:predicted cupin superfamily sugar epimerase